MKIVYHCYGGTHSSVLAAALHTGKLNGCLPVTWQHLFRLPYFDRVDKKNSGKIYYIGRDEAGNEVYIMGCRNAGHIVETVIYQLETVIPMDTAELLLVSTIPCLNTLMRIGGFLSRQVGLTTTGRIFLLYGTRQALPKIIKLVREVKKKKLNLSCQDRI